MEREASMIPADTEDHCRHARAGSLTRRSFTTGFLGGFVAASCPAASFELSAPPREGSIRVGLTPVFLSNDLEVLDELQAYLAAAMKRDVQLVTQRTYQEVTALLVSGNLHVAWICGYPYMKFRNELELVATPVWRGRPLYQSYLIVGSGSAAITFDDCRGHVHAFSDPDSNSGYLVTKTYLAERHVSEERFFRKSLFTYGHRNVIRAVSSGLADSGSVDGYVWEVMRETEPDLVSRTRVLLKSAWHGFPPFAAPLRLKDTSVFRDIQTALLSMNSDAVGRSVLGRLRLDGFSTTSDDSYQSIAASMDIVRRLG